MEKNEIISIIRELVHPRYKLNDAAHRIVHADEVCTRAIDYCDKEEVSDTILKQAIVTAYCHDVGCSINRNDHAINSGKWVEENSKKLKLQLKMDDEDIKMIAAGCREHSASYKGDYTSMVSEIVSSADRCVSLDPKSLYRRSYCYSRNEMGLNMKESAENTVKYTYDQYKRNGDARLPDIFIKYNKESLDKFYDSLEEVNKIILKDKLFWLECEKIYLAKKILMAYHKF